MRFIQSDGVEAVITLVHWVVRDATELLCERSSLQSAEDRICLTDPKQRMWVCWCAGEDRQHRWRSSPRPCRRYRWGSESGGGKSVNYIH